jgi:hypothetical protein
VVRTAVLDRNFFVMPRPDFECGPTSNVDSVHFIC